MSRPHGLARGFTLIEVVVTVLLIGIAVAVVAPSVPGLSFGDAEEVAPYSSLLERSRRTALREGRTIAVRLDLADGRYEVLAFPTFTAVNAENADSSMLIEAGPLTGDADLRTQPRTATPEFRFSAEGRATGPSLRIRSSEGETWLLTVDPWTGAVRVRLASN